MNVLHFNKDTLKELMVIAMPMVVSQGAFAVMIFTDRYFMSQIDATHIAASMGGGVALFFTICFFTGVVSYANALVAQYLGAGEKAKCPKVVTQGLLMSLAILPVLLLLAIPVAESFLWFGHEAELARLERQYFVILMAGSILMLAKYCFSSYFAGIARTSVVMICDVCGLLVNVPLCYVMVFGKLGMPALGIEGAAYSTVLSTFVSLLLFVLFYLRRSHREEFSVAKSFHFDKGIFRRYARLGAPSGAELFLNFAAFSGFLAMYQSYGIIEGASSAIVFNWDILSYVPMIGLNIGVISLIGRFVGARDMAKTNEVISAGFVLGVGYSGCLALLYVFFRYPLVEVFTPPGGDFSQIRELAAFMMLGLATYTIGDALSLVAGGVLRGAGDTRWLMFASASVHWLMLVAQYFIIKVFELGPRVSWIAFMLMILAMAVVYLMRLRGGRWREQERLDRVMAEY